ncbi:hypothetical protein V6N13_080533 [Hibiscus sabdariffa]|uniref:Uncharacterized protein n=1 Tax=Hibiscus sabdariffa TaxID=183260 RepID=A0ABR2PZ48_9ROSI
MTGAEPSTREIEPQRSYLGGVNSRRFGKTGGWSFARRLPHQHQLLRRQMRQRSAPERWSGECSERCRFQAGLWAKRTRRETSGRSGELKLSR